MNDELSTIPNCVPSRHALHEDQTFCTEFLATIKAAVPLRISQSKVLGAGSGLSVTEDVDSGQELFRSVPVINCIRDGYQNLVCDYCYLYKNSKLSSVGRFRTAGDRTPDIKACQGCKVCYYCSKVMSFTCDFTLAQKA
jgi:hypothetical protein